MFNVKFIDLVEQVSLEVLKDKEPVGILATTKTVEEKLYDQYLSNMKIVYPAEEEQKIVSEIILRIIRGKSTKEDRLYLKKLILELKQRGAKKVILGCTDLSILLNEELDFIDSTEVLIRAVKREMVSR